MTEPTVYQQLSEQELLERSETLKVAEYTCQELRARGVEIGPLKFLAACQAADERLAAELGPATTPFEQAKQELIQEFASILHELTPGEVDHWIKVKSAQQAVLEACASQDEFDVDWVEGVAQAELALRELLDEQV